jgi:hypothetical protein
MVLELKSVNGYVQNVVVYYVRYEFLLFYLENSR